jgi:hypothetical protein
MCGLFLTVNGSCVCTPVDNNEQQVINIDRAISCHIGGA